MHSCWTKVLCHSRNIGILKKNVNNYLLWKICINLQLAAFVADNQCDLKLNIRALISVPIIFTIPLCWDVSKLFVLGAKVILSIGTLKTPLKLGTDDLNLVPTSREESDKKRTANWQMVQRLWLYFVNNEENKQKINVFN